MNVKKLRNNPFQHFVGIEVISLGNGNSILQLELREHHYLLEHGLLEANVGATDYDVNEPTMGIGGGS